MKKNLVVSNNVKWTWKCKKCGTRYSGNSAPSPWSLPECHPGGHNWEKI